MVAEASRIVSAHGCDTRFAFQRVCVPLACVPRRTFGGCSLCLSTLRSQPGAVGAAARGHSCVQLRRPEPAGRDALLSAPKRRVKKMPVPD